MALAGLMWWVLLGLGWDWIWIGAADKAHRGDRRHQTTEATAKQKDRQVFVQQAVVTAMAQQAIDCQSDCAAAGSAPLWSPWSWWRVDAR
jgi:hypothetical protein